MHLRWVLEIEGENHNYNDNNNTPLQSLLLGRGEPRDADALRGVQAVWRAACMSVLVADGAPANRASAISNTAASCDHRAAMRYASISVGTRPSPLAGYLAFPLYS